MKPEKEASEIPPRLSAILVIPAHYDSVKQTLAALRAQTICHEIEVVLVAPEGAIIDVPIEQVQQFHSWQKVRIAELLSVAQGYTHGVRAASALIVVFTEDHSFPEPEWAASLLAAYARPYSAVGPALYNANPTNWISWADFFIAYGAWAGPQPSGERPFLPGHNSSYRRDILLSLENLETWLEVETILHWDLARNGHSLYLAGDAHTHHTNFGQFSIWTQVQYNVGRRFAGFRSASWPWPKRLAYTAASFLIPLIRFRRIASQARRVEIDMPMLPILFLILMWGLSADGLGQLIGYGLGPGRSVQVIGPFEFERDRFV